MKEILNNKIFRAILCVFIITSMFFLPSIFKALLELTFLKNEYVIAVLSLTLYLLFLIIIYFIELKPEFLTFKKNFKENLDTGLKYWMLGLFIMLVSNIVINYLIMGGNIAANEELNRRAILENPIWYTIFSISITAPILEEIIFRKSTDKIFKSEKVYYIISALLFGLAHVVADLSSALNLLYIIPYGSLGFAFAMMDKKTNTTFTSIVFHFLHNTITLILLLSIL